MAWLKVFEDPRDAVEREIAHILAQPFVPEDIRLHRLLYHTSSGAVEVVVDGYQD